MAERSTHGGARLGAGRHAIENKRVTFNAMIAPETFAAIVEQSEKLGLSRGKVIDLAIATLTEVCENDA
mgnify:FL=1